MVLTYRYAFSIGKYPTFNLSCHETNISLIAKSYDIFNFVRNPGWGYKNIISKVEDGLSRSKLEYYGTYLQQPSFVIGESSF